MAFLVLLIQDPPRGINDEPAPEHAAMTEAEALAATRAKGQWGTDYKTIFTNPYFMYGLAGRDGRLLLPVSTDRPTLGVGSVSACLPALSLLSTSVPCNNQTYKQTNTIHLAGQWRAGGLDADLPQPLPGPLPPGRYVRTYVSTPHHTCLRGEAG